jgi:hypothetical protein
MLTPARESMRAGEANMRSWGIWFIIMGAGSYLLRMFGMDFILVSWVDSWGATTGHIIRGAVVLLGIVMVVAGGRGEAEGPVVTSTRPPQP